MGQCGAGLVCFGLLALVFVQDCVASKSLFRLRRQIASWRWSSDARRQQGADTRSVGRRGSAIAYNQRDGVGFVGYPTGGLQPRQVQPPQNAPISVQCGEDRMLVTVNTDINGDGKLVEAADLTLGPQSCGPGPQSRSTTLVFEVGLRDCGNSLQMTPDWLIYSTNLTFKSVTSIQKVNVSAVVPIQCYYPRYGNVSSKAIRPTWLPFASTLSTEERLVFSLRLMTEDWSAPRSLLVYSPGDVFYIEASVETRNHMPLILYVDSCVATPSPEVSSGPRYEIIAHNGCLIDGTQEDSGSTFRSPRPQLDKLQFMVDAFWFTDYDMATIYITCSLRAAVDTKVLDPMNKACSYNRTTSR
ncbi:zona pellucida sperm-binding protein 3-like [Leptodactylus fuscus]